MSRYMVFGHWWKLLGMTVNIWKIAEPFVETLRAKTKDRSTGLSELGIDAVIIDEQIIRPSSGM
jgi:hypothetical protein